MHQISRNQLKIYKIIRLKTKILILCYVLTEVYIRFVNCRTQHCKNDNSPPNCPVDYNPSSSGE